MACSFNMSFTSVVMMILLGSSVVVAFILQPSQEKSGHSIPSTVYHQSCHGESLQSIKRDLLKSMNLRSEPLVSVGFLDSVREHWENAFSDVSFKANEAEEAQAASANFDGGHINSSLKCCSMTSEIFMKDLDWDNWVIYPSCLTIINCKLCSKEGNTVQCPLPQATPQNGQVPCCHSTSQKMVPIVYMDEFGSVVISSVQMTRGCGCETVLGF